MDFVTFSGMTAAETSDFMSDFGPVVDLEGGPEGTEDYASKSHEDFNFDKRWNAICVFSESRR